MADLAGVFIPLIFVVVGGFIFWTGFKRMNNLRLIQDTPRSKIQSMAMGIVEIHGEVAKGKKLLKSPFSLTPCVYWKGRTEEYKRHVYRHEGKTKVVYEWVPIDVGWKATNFIAKDETGEVPVICKGAEYKMNVKRTFYKHVLGHRKEVKHSNWRVRGGPQGVKEGMSRLALKHWLNPLHFSFGIIRLFTGPRVGDKRYFEWYLEPGEDLFVIGSADHHNYVDPKNEKKVLETVVAVKKGENNPTFLISHMAEADLLRALWKDMILYFIFGGMFIIGGIGFILVWMIA